jgi:type I restriction enzyme S subunit
MRDGWVETNLGEIADVIGGGTPSTTIPEYWDGKIVWLTPTEITSQDGKVVSDSIRKITDLGFKNSGAQMLPKDSVILTSRASVGYVALAGQDLCTNQGFQSLIPKQSVLPKFLMFWIQQNRSEFESRSAGSTFKEISKSNVKSIKLNLPPLPEQKRIVDLISSVDSYIEALQQQLESGTKSRNAVLRELLTVGGEGWVETTLDGIAQVVMGQSPDGKSYNQEGKGLPFMQGSAEFGEHNPVPEKWCSDPKKIAEPGDLLLSVRAPVGDTNFADQRIAVGRGLSIIRANKESLTEFIRLVIQLNVAELIASSGSGMFASITGKNLKEFKVNLPPLPEQKRIVEIINTIDEVIAKTALTTNKAIELRSGLLSDLLSGEHEIPDSYDKVIGAA